MPLMSAVQSIAVLVERRFHALDKMTSVIFLEQGESASEHRSLLAFRVALPVVASLEKLRASR